MGREFTVVIHNGESLVAFSLLSPDNATYKMRYETSGVIFPFDEYGLTQS